MGAEDASIDVSTDLSTDLSATWLKRDAETSAECEAARDEGACDAGDECPDEAIASAFEANHVAVGPSACGQGVFAGRRFEPEDLIGPILGDVIDDPDYGSSYSMDLGGTLTLEPFAPFRFLNHSCQPNCGLLVEEFEDGSAPQIWVEVLAPIEPGDELLIDYAWPADCAIECQCGSPECRGWIVAEQELHELRAALTVESTCEGAAPMESTQGSPA